MLRALADVRHALDGGCTGSNDRHTLTGEAGQISCRITAGVVIVPSASMEGVPPETVDTRDTRQFGPIQRPIRHDDVTRAKLVAAVGADHPSAFGFVPAHLLNF